MDSLAGPGEESRGFGVTREEEEREENVGFGPRGPFHQQHFVVATAAA